MHLIKKITARINCITYIFLSLLVISGASSCSGSIENYKYIGFFPGEGIMGYDGSWHDMSEGLPEEFNAENITSDSGGALYLTTEYSGIWRLEKGEKKWKSISSPALKRRSQYGIDEYRQISAFSIDSSDDSKLYAATKHVIYTSKDRGVSWEKLHVAENKNSYYFTSLTVIDGVLYAGTSFNGVLRITPTSTTEINDGVPKEFYVGPFHFCEEVSSIAASKGVLYSGYLFGRGMVETSDWKKWTKVNIPVKDEKREGVHGISPFKDVLFVSTSESVYEYNPSTKKIIESPVSAELKKSFESDGPEILYVRGSSSNPPLFMKRNIREYKIEDKSKSGDKQALYVSWSMINSNFKGFLDIVNRNGFNAVVIDVKDDHGIINAPIESKTARELGAIRDTNIKDIVKQLHDMDVYVIARNVTFKDKKMYEAYGNKYAIWDKVSNTPWVGLPRERWCDPYSKFVRDYNIEIARETAKLGFDEIQFDYIRFPTDGLTGRCLYRYREKDDTFKSEILGDFLQQARKECGVPVSLDIYGFNAWYRFGNIIGQDIQFLSRFADAIYPMVYPSHFGATFYDRYSKEDRPYWIVRDSEIRSVYHSRGRTVIRLWIQDWDYLSPTWGPDYILKQVKGVHDGGGKSYSFWNPKGDHSMSDKAFNGKKP